MPSLQRLSILDTYREGNDSDFKVVIKTPTLMRYLNVVDKCDSGLLFLSENMPDMVVANVSVVYKNPEMLMRSFTSVKRLSLCLTTSMVSKTKKEPVYYCDLNSYYLFAHVLIMF